MCPHIPLPARTKTSIDDNQLFLECLENPQEFALPDVCEANKCINHFTASSITSLPLSITLPAASATLAYLNAKYDVSYDVHFLKAVFRSLLAVSRPQKLNRLNTYYEFESNALDPKSANKTYLVFENKSYSYREVYSMILKYAAWLKHTYDIKPGEVIAMDFVNSDTFVFLWWALWSLGAKAAFINYNLTGQPLIHCIKSSSTRLLFIDSSLAHALTPEVRAHLGDTSVQLVPWSQDIDFAIAATKPVRQPDCLRSGQEPHSMALLIFTSGTTGHPKAAVVSWSRVNRGGAFASSWLGLKPSDRFFTCMPLYHSAGSLLGTVTCVYAKCTLVLGRRFSPSTFWDTARATRATAIQYVGETCRYLVAQPPSPLDKQHSVRIAFGNGMRPDVWHAFKDRFGIDSIAEFYAATEGVGSSWNLSRNAFSAGAIGRVGMLTRLVMSNTSKVVAYDDEADAPVRDPATGLCKILPRGEPGEHFARIADPSKIEESFQGYFGNEAASSKKIVRDVETKGDAFFRSGDLVRWDGDGRVYFLDRIGDTFRWKSENVSTAEVGEVLGMHPDVLEANVYGVQLPHHDGRAGCAAIVLRSGAVQPDAATLRGLAAHARSSLASYAVPLFLRFTAQMEATGTVKSLKHKLREEGVDPARCGAGGDRMYWAAKDLASYVPFGAKEWGALNGGRVRL